MILAAFRAALSQWRDRSFRRVIWLGILLALLLLVAIYALFLLVITTLAPGSISFGDFGEFTSLRELLGFASLILMLVASVFLMVPVAAAFAGIFIEDVADAVEARHYSWLPPARRLGMAETFRSSVNLIGLILLVNVIAVFVLPMSGFLALPLWWAMNGVLLGREYFMLVAQRRLPLEEARAMFARNRARIWTAGTLIAVPLSLPLLSLVIPVLGTATFTHLFHRLRASET